LLSGALEKEASKEEEQAPEEEEVPEKFPKCLFRQNYFHRWQPRKLVSF